MRHWNWDDMVEANRAKLLRLLAGLLALVGSGETVRRVVRRRLLAALVPMESAARRLIYVAARDLIATLRPPRGGGGSRTGPRGAPGAHGAAFVLTDRPRVPDPPPRRCPERLAPRVMYLDEWCPRDPHPDPSDDDPVAAAPVRRRLAALGRALDDLPAQARRVARWRARNARAGDSGPRRRLYPFRSGRPPGQRTRRRRPAHDRLADCHDLALRCRYMLETERYGG